MPLPVLLGLVEGKFEISGGEPRPGFCAGGRLKANVEFIHVALGGGGKS